MNSDGSHGAITELAALLARGYIQLLVSRAEKTRNDATSPLENGTVSPTILLDSRAETRPPCVGDERHEGVR